MCHILGQGRPRNQINDRGPIASQGQIERQRVKEIGDDPLVQRHGALRRQVHTFDINVGCIFRHAAAHQYINYLVAQPQVWGNYVGWVRSLLDQQRQQWRDFLVVVPRDQRLHEGCQQCRFARPARRLQQVDQPRDQLGVGYNQIQSDDILAQLPDHSMRQGLQRQRVKILNLGPGNGNGLRHTPLRQCRRQPREDRFAAGNPALPRECLRVGLRIQFGKLMIDNRDLKLLGHIQKGCNGTRQIRAGGIIGLAVQGIKGSQGRSRSPKRIAGQHQCDKVSGFILNHRDLAQHAQA